MRLQQQRWRWSRPRYSRRRKRWLMRLHFATQQPTTRWRLRLPRRPQRLRRLRPQSNRSHNSRDSTAPADGTRRPWLAGDIRNRSQADGTPWLRRRGRCGPRRSRLRQWWCRRRCWCGWCRHIHCAKWCRRRCWCGLSLDRRCVKSFRRTRCCGSHPGRTSPTSCRRSGSSANKPTRSANGSSVMARLRQLTIILCFMFQLLITVTSRAWPWLEVWRLIELADEHRQTECALLLLPSSAAKTYQRARIHRASSR